MQYIKGFDLSTLPEVERCGGKFYQNGVERDAMAILRDHGANWVRLRLWNDPYTPDGRPYGAGLCDLPLVLGMARRAKTMGLKWLLDLHYSDFWADPGKQTVPKAWRGMGEEQLEQAVYRYTADVLCACRANGTPPDMVQVGNELSNGLLWQEGKAPNWDNIARLVLAGVRAVREFDASVPVMVHLDNGGRQELYRTWFDNYFARGGECDVIGLSYYPYWHGRMEELAANMAMVAERYRKDLIVVETSVGFSMQSYADKEHLAENARKGSAVRPKLAQIAGYEVSPQGQCAFVRQLLDVIDNVPNGRCRGFFWWEPAWIPVPGSGWAEQPGWEYVQEEGPGGNEWANQTLFDYDGNILPAMELIRDHVPRHP